MVLSKMVVFEIGMKMKVKPKEFSLFVLLVALAGTVALAMAVLMIWVSEYTPHSASVLHGVGLLCWLYAAIAVFEAGHA